MAQRFLTHSTPVLIAANSAVVATAALGGWMRNELFRVYLLELVVVGLIGMLQIHRAAKPGALAKSRGYLLIFFVAHYGTFCALYFALLPRLAWPDFEALAPEDWMLVLLCVAALAAAHATSFVFDYLPREALRISSMQANFLPYARVLPVQLPLIAAAILAPTDGGAGEAIVFALAKTVADVITHIALHRRLTAYAT